MVSSSSLKSQFSMASSGLFAAVVQDFSRKREIPLEAVVLQYRVACPEAEVTLIKFDSLNITLWVHQSH